MAGSPDLGGGAGSDASFLKDRGTCDLVNVGHLLPAPQTARGTSVPSAPLGPLQHLQGPQPCP